MHVNIEFGQNCNVEDNFVTALAIFKSSRFDFKLFIWKALLFSGAKALIQIQHLRIHN